ncbi:hypothetical protein PL11201_580032 [Planktothrix sp. PCC 11201]|uniref:hypothetical protein n=1 Tax=Planktothrix sp. PCC 11201 TaxID=1729650 RepID=UPI0009240F10|nr:hypothetical protein [Planktothrix sp. PCC 11201]SKB14040.1 hypothetical protein PL11201_580032 [Planktothrix sp. PCC 11201]
MAYLRLVSSVKKKEFSITTRVIVGYCIDSLGETLILYTQSYPIEIYSSFVEGWDNWDEFIEQVKKMFKESNDDF